MTEALAHRGRDGCGTELLRGVDGSAGGEFGHRRLAILDLSAAGLQPMTDGDATGHRLLITFNGEIYNFRALRAELEGAGIRFRSGSDTEVLLAGWRTWGPAFLPKLRGMYAFAMWDRERRIGIVARDPFGIKPLYVAATRDALWFASEVRALAGVAGPPRISPDAVGAYLAYGSVPEPLTILEGVRAFPPGAWAEISLHDGRVRVSDPRPFARPLEPAGARDAAPAEVGALVRDALRDSVAHHLVSDVPVAAFLSGGIDSSAVVALAAESAAGRLDTFTVTFSEAAFDESAVAARVAKRFGTRHHDVPLSAVDLLDALPGAFAAMDQPSMDGLNTFVVSRAVARGGFKVVLSGLGGDELFAGYPSFRRAQMLAPVWGEHLRPVVRRLAAAVADHGPGRLRKATSLLGARSAAHAAYEVSRTLFSREAVRALAGPAAVPEPPPPPPGLTLLQEVSWYELTGYMRNTLLRDSDVFSMASHLELRVPFLDREVARAALAVPDRAKLGARSKPALIAALGDLLPREVWDRPKQGFTLPFQTWMRGALRGEVAAALGSAARLRRVGLTEPAVRDIWRSFAEGRGGVSWGRPWALYTLVRWAEQLGWSIAHEPAGARETGS
jgi:asparagine synthase (glutamine-hydrolysing)